MARKLGLALIVGGIIGAYVGFWNLNNACENSKRIRNEYYSNQQMEKRNMDVERSPQMKLNSAYGGLSAAGILASLFAVGGGGYLLAGRKGNDSE